MALTLNPNSIKLSNLSPAFITFEGGEGVGKTTLMDNFCEFLCQQEIAFVRTREPGGSEVGELLRKIFLSPSHQLNADSELLMIFSARVDHLDKVILPALARGQWVICDRFLDSTIAYQAFGRWGHDPMLLADMLKKIQLLIEQFLPKLPDARFWLDLDPAVGRMRAKQRGVLDRLEQESPNFHHQVYQGFAYQYMHANDGTMVRLDASDAPKGVLEQILTYW